MAHLITPITVEGVEVCCNPATRHTPVVLIEAASEIAPDQWEIFRATAYGDEITNSDAKSTEEAVSGTVVFGVCCASQVILEVCGEIANDNVWWRAKLVSIS